MVLLYCARHRTMSHFVIRCNSCICFICLGPKQMHRNYFRITTALCHFMAVAYLLANMSLSKWECMQLWLICMHFLLDAFICYTFPVFVNELWKQTILCKIISSRMIPELRNLPYLQRLDKLKLWTLEERRVRADLIEVYSTEWSMDYHPFLLIPSSNSTGMDIPEDIHLS